MLTMQCTGVGEQPVFTWTITRANPVIAVVRLHTGTLMNIRVGELSGSDATKALHKTILDHNDASSKQTRQILILTYAMLLLTAVMTILVAVQIWLALRSTTDQVPTSTTPQTQNLTP